MDDIFSNDMMYDMYDDIFVNAIALVLVYNYVCPCRCNDIIRIEPQTYENLEDTTNKSCIICFEEYDKQSLIYKLNCKHVFHKECLDTWFKNKPTCPLCRLKIND